MDPDNLIQNPDGENTETPIGSQPESITAEDGTTVNPQGAGDPNSEEAIWNSLSGPAQDRFKRMARDAKQAREENEMLKARSAYQVPMPPVNTNQMTDPEVASVLDKLAGFGIATDAKVERLVNERINQSVGALAYQYELDKLESKYNGSDGKPAFSRDEYENFVNAHPQYRNYQLEDVYEKMFKDELRLQTPQTISTNRTTSLRPTKTTVREEQWTPQAIEDKLQSLPERDRPAWVDKNKSLIDSVLLRDTAN